MRINTNKLKANTRNKLKGKLFEVVLQSLLIKAGFSSNFQSEQFTKNLLKIRGRGATYKPDLVGVFNLGIPFVNPLLIIGEAKYYKAAIGLPKVREFLGSYIDFSQFPSINTVKSGDLRYEVLFGTRFNYCPIYFSIKGFQQSATGLMYAHGINYISYENSLIISKFERYIEKILDNIRLIDIKTDDFRLFSNIDLLPNVNEHLIKRNYFRSVENLLSYLNRVNSIIGVLDLRFPLHVLYEKKVTASLSREVKIVLHEGNSFILTNDAGRKFGEFTFMNSTFITKYIKYARKKGFEDTIFKQIDIIVKNKSRTGRDLWSIRQLLIKEGARQDIISHFQPLSSKESSTKAT